jgi:SAM-dependent methyltransferase
LRLSSVPENLFEWIALACDVVPTPILDTMVGLLLAKTILAAAEMNVFDVLEAGPCTTEEIAKKCGTHLLPTEKLLRALYACRYLRYKNQRYGLAPVSRRWLLTSGPRSLHSAVLHRKLDLRAMTFETYLRAGRGAGFHESLEPEDWRRYQQGQASHAVLTLDEVISRAPMPDGARDLLDLGGAHGLYSFGFCNRYPQLRARVVDLAVPSGALDSPWMAQIPFDRVEFEQADILAVDFPERAFDAVLIANVFHHFDEASNRDLVQRAAKALRPGGIAIAIDAVRPAAIERSEQIESLLDFYFGAASGAGLWTIEQLRSWQESAGLELLAPVTMRLVPCCKMQVGRKPRRSSNSFEPERGARKTTLHGTPDVVRPGLPWPFSWFRSSPSQCSRGNVASGASRKKEPALLPVFAL